MENKFESKFAEGEGKKERYEISREAIRAFESKKFKDTFLKTLREVHRYRREWGFLIAREIASGKFHYSKPIGSEFETETALDTAWEEIEKSLEKKRIERNKWYIFARCHFHGFKSEESVVLCPSFYDLEGGAIIRECHRDDMGGIGFDIPPIQMIAGMTSTTDADVLVFREPINYLPIKKLAIWKEIRETFDTLGEESILQRISQEEVIKTLEHYGYKAGMIHISQGKLQESDIKFLESFAMFAPKVEPEEPPELNDIN